ncbi:MAG: hypothetical protein OXI18_09360 [bacterium]|nr:hypothetical protein [bacterium]
MSTLGPQLVSNYCRDGAIAQRNTGWQTHELVPDWVDPKDVGLDEFFTRPAIAESCYQSLLAWMRDDGADPVSYRFIEPSAGTGAFYDLLPEARRIGVDLIPYRLDYDIADFLSWAPPQNGLQYAVVGNPPFGHRSWLALAFVNRAATFADYVGMILPMSFQSDGKGSPKHRVRGLRLVHTDQLPSDAFQDVHGRAVKVNALWQVWQRGVNNSRRLPSSNKWVDLFAVDARPHRLCGQARLQDAQCFVERTFYGDAPSLLDDFASVRHRDGYGVIIKREPDRVLTALRNANWRKHSNLATHNCRHVTMHHIVRVLADAGMADD